MRITRAAAGLALAAALVAAAASAQPEIPPAPTRWVTDTPGFLSESTRRSLDARLERYERDTGRQVIVWIGRSISRGELEDFAVRAFDAWNIGRKGQDDGVAIFVFPIGGPGQRHLRIEVGYGVEGVLPDIVANQIIEDVAIPRLQAGQPDEAIVATVSAVLQRLGGETSPPPRVAPVPVPRTTQPQQPSIPGMILFGILAIGFLILLVTNPRLALWLLFSIMSGGRGGGRGGGFGGGGGGFSGGGGRSGGGGASGSW